MVRLFATYSEVLSGGKRESQVVRHSECHPDTLRSAVLGYMSAIKFFTNNCIASEPCPMFLGYPACYFGFGLFATLFPTSVLGLVRVLQVETMRLVLRLVSLGGVLFAGNFVAQEVQRFWVNGFQTSTFGLPTAPTD